VSSDNTRQAVSINDARLDPLRALPARYYIDRDILMQEKELLFFKTWQYACHLSELDEPGAYVATEILGQNVFVVRGEDGEVKAFYNVCPHRGHKLLEATGKKRVIVCPYHQ
jgi:choline monooxygenase